MGLRSRLKLVDDIMSRFPCPLWMLSHVCNLPCMLSNTGRGGLFSACFCSRSSKFSRNHRIIVMPTSSAVRLPDEAIDGRRVPFILVAQSAPSILKVL